ncbi:hypothetical protein ACTA71_005020 [Dictyostelium dimigraforme]
MHQKIISNNCISRKNNIVIEKAKFSFLSSIFQDRINKDDGFKEYSPVGSRKNMKNVIILVAQVCASLKVNHFINMNLLRNLDIIILTQEHQNNKPEEEKENGARRKKRKTQLWSCIFWNETDEKYEMIQDELSEYESFISSEAIE